MKATFELSVNKDGNPVIKFSHHDKDSSLDQKMLNVFINKAFKNGIRINKVGGYCEIGSSVSFDKYEIVVNDI